MAIASDNVSRSCEGCRPHPVQCAVQLGLKIQTSSGPTLRVTTASNWTPRSKCRKFPTIIEAIYQNLPRFQITVADRVYGHQLAYA
jgi:hypothetical protein